MKNLRFRLFPSLVVGLLFWVIIIASNYGSFVEAEYLEINHDKQYLIEAKTNLEKLMPTIQMKF